MAIERLKYLSWSQPGDLQVVCVMYHDALAV